MDRPIIFSAPMVRALLDGRKTQTRRLLKPRPYVVQEKDGIRWWNLAGRPGGMIVMGDDALLRAHRQPAPGDRLWVREAHHRSDDDGTPLIGYDFADDPTFGPDRIEQRPGIGPVHLFRRSLGGWGGRTSRNFPSIHMPRWASRLTLTVTAVRVERLQEISEADARAEGMTGIRYQDCDGDPRLDGRIYIDTAWHADPSALRTEGDVASGAPNARFAFRNLWDTLHGPGAWDANPEVVVLTFTVRKGNIDHA